MSGRLGVTCAILAFNEEDNIVAAVDEVHGELSRSGRPFEIVIVDDCSKDRTGPIADSLAERLSQPGAVVRVIRHARNLGPGSGIITGVSEATLPLYCFHPGDNQVRFSDVAAALELLDEDYDILVGERSDRRDYSAARKSDVRGR